MAKKTHPEMIPGMKKEENMMKKWAKKETIHVPWDPVSAFKSRVIDDAARPAVFKDRKKAARTDRGQWKSDLKKGIYD